MLAIVLFGVCFVGVCFSVLSIVGVTDDDGPVIAKVEE